MKTKRRRLSALLITMMALALVLTLAAPAWGQDDDPPIPVDEYGIPDRDQIDLTHVGEYTDCVLCVDIPGIGETGFALQYDVYADNYGNTWVVPNNLTVLYMAATGYVPPGMAGQIPAYNYESGLGYVIEQLGGLEAVGITPEMAQENSSIQWEAIQNNEEGALQGFFEATASNVDFWLALSITGALESGGSPASNFTSMWVYDHNPFDPDAAAAGTPEFGTPQSTPGLISTDEPPPPEPTRTPRPTPTPMPTATPMATPVECPPESISQQPPQAIIVDTFPPNPVVVGQGGWGLDINVEAVSYPVIHRWWTRAREWECSWWDSATYGPPHANHGHCCPDDQPDCDSSDYYEIPGEWKCVEHAEAIPDPILMEYFGATANLHASSIEWIQTDLAGKYPGAEVHHANWYVSTEAEPVLYGDGRCVVEAKLWFPFEDPGYYDVSVHGQTAGTIYTPPRSFGYAMPTPQAVYLLDTMLEE